MTVDRQEIMRLMRECVDCQAKMHDQRMESARYYRNPVDDAVNSAPSPDTGLDSPPPNPRKDDSVPTRLFSA